MGRIEDLAIVKKTADIRKNKNPAYKQDFLPKNWRKPFKATIQWRPKPTYLFNWQKGLPMTAGIPTFTAYGAQARLPGRRRRKHKRKYSKK